MLAEQGLLEPVTGVSVGLWHQVAVAVEGDLDGRVARPRIAAPQRPS